MKNTLLTLLCLLPMLASAQLIENFEGTWTTPSSATGPGGPAGWAIANVSGPNQTWVQGSGGSYAGAHHATIASESVTTGTTQDWLISPSFTVPVNGMLSFYSKLSQPGNQGSTYKVMISTTTGSQTVTSNYQAVAEWNEVELNPVQASWMNKTVSLTAYAGQQVHIAFVMEGNGGDNWSIDNVAVTESCPQVTNVTFSNIGLTTFTVSWVADGGTSWMVEVVPQSAAPTGSGFIATTNMYTAVGLSGGPYKVYITTICANGIQGPVAGPFEVMLPVCTPDNQCTYTFNLTDSGNNGWGGALVNVVQAGVVVQGITLSEGASSSIEIGLCDAVPYELQWITPGDAPAEIGLSVSNSNMQTVYTYTAQDFVPNAVLYSGMTQCMQDACYAPYNVAVTVDGTNATVTWQGEGALGFDYFLTPYETAEYPSNTTVPTGTGVFSPLLLEDLTPGTTYIVYVRSVCSGMFGNINSQWSDPLMFTVAADNIVTGTVTADVNGDGICNAQDVAIPYAELEVTVGTDAPFVIYADYEGNFVIDSLPYQANLPIIIAPVAPQGFEPLVPVNLSVTLPSLTPPQVGVCFQVADVPYNDVDVTIIPVTSPLLGFAGSCAVVVHNNSAFTAQGVTVVLTYQENNVVISSVTTSFAPVSSNSVIIEIADIAPFSNSYATVFYDVLPPPYNEMNDVLGFTGVVAMNGDQNANNNTATLQQTVVSSYDPNDITVHEGDWVAIEDAGEYLNYTIRFQNTGTAPAVNIQIENALHENLDWSTFQPLASSHDFTVTRNPGNLLEFSFNEIFLPDSTSNEAGSHGFVTYRIKPKADVVVNDVVESTASIYFDFNEPVVTNTAMTTFGVLSLAEVNPLKISLYPNPVKELLHINVQYATLKSVLVYDLNGRLCLQSNNQTVIDTQQLNAGLYLVKVETDSGTAAYKLVKQ